MLGGYRAFYHTGLGGVQALLVIPDLKLVLVQRTNTDTDYVDKEMGLELGLKIINARI